MHNPFYFYFRYKRIQWKQKMKARSESYGNKCFKCGQEGHWANKCKGNAFMEISQCLQNHRTLKNMNKPLKMAKKR